MRSFTVFLDKADAERLDQSSLLVAGSAFLAFAFALAAFLALGAGDFEACGDAAFAADPLGPVPFLGVGVFFSSTPGAGAGLGASTTAFGAGAGLGASTAGFGAGAGLGAVIPEAFSWSSKTLILA